MIIHSKHSGFHAGVQRAMGKDGGGGGGSSTQRVVQQVDPQIKGAYLGNVDYARQTANQLGARQFAGFDPLYQMGESQALAAGQGMGRQQLGQAGQLTQAAAGFSPAMIRPDSSLVQQYYNPFEQQVIDTGLQDLERARQQAVQQMGQQATAARAFGGSRHGVAEALTSGEFGRQAGSLVANLRSQGFQSAMDRATQQQLANQQAGMQGAGFRLGAAQQLGQMGQAQTAADMLAAQTAMALGGSRQQLAQQQLDAARNLGMERLGLMQGAIGLQPPGMGGMSTTSGTGPGSYSNPAMGALGGAAIGSQISALGPYGWAIGGGLGLLGSM
jgi:hypothetical protein